MKLEDFLGGNAPIPMKAKGKHMDDNRLQNAQGRELGLFSTLSSYLLSPYTFGNGGPSPNDANVEDDMPSFISRGDVSEKDIEATLCTVDCMAACKLDEVYSNLPYVIIVIILCVLANIVLPICQLLVLYLSMHFYLRLRHFLLY